MIYRRRVGGGACLSAKVIEAPNPCAPRHKKMAKKNDFTDGWMDGWKPRCRANCARGATINARFLFPADFGSVRLHPSRLFQWKQVNGQTRGAAFSPDGLPRCFGAMPDSLTLPIENTQASLHEVFPLSGSRVQAPLVHLSVQPRKWKQSPLCPPHSFA